MATKSSEKQTQRDEGSSRERILAAAEELFAETSFDGTSVRQIALKAGVPVGLINYHFDGKLGVYRAIFELRTPAVVEMRRAGLALAALEDNKERKLEMTLKAVLVPMLNLRTSEGSNHFGSLLARETNDARSHERGIVQEMLDPIALEVVAQLRALMPKRSKAEVHWAYQMVIGVMAFIMSDSGRISRLSDGEADPAKVDATLRALLPLLLHGINGREAALSATNKD